MLHQPSFQYRFLLYGDQILYKLLLLLLVKLVPVRILTLDGGYSDIAFQFFVATLFEIEFGFFVKVEGLPDLWEGDCGF